MLFQRKIAVPKVAEELWSSDTVRNLPLIEIVGTVAFSVTNRRSIDANAIATVDLTIQTYLTGAEKRIVFKLIA